MNSPLYSSEIPSEDDDLRRLLVESATAFVAARRDVARIKLDADPLRGFDPAIWREMTDLGWPSLGLTEGLGLAHACALAEQLGAGFIPEPYIACGVMPSAILKHAPASDVRDELTAMLTTAAVPVTLAWQERLGQLDPDMVETRADDDDRLHGGKLFTPNADIAKAFIVSVRRKDGLALAVVRTDAPGLTRELHRTGDGSMRGHVSFDGAPISGWLAGPEHAPTALREAIDQGALASAAYQTGLARTVLDQILSHLKTRVQFDRPLGTFQTLRHQAGDLYMGVRTAAASWARAARLWDAAPGSDEAVAAISAAKAGASQAALKTARAGIQILGGVGFAEEADCGLALRIAQQHASWLGGETAHLRRFSSFTRLVR